MYSITLCNKLLGLSRQLRKGSGPPSATESIFGSRVPLTAGQKEDPDRCRDESMRDKPED
jgi:hypothetical protein